MQGIHPFVDSLFRSLYFILSLIFILFLIRVGSKHRKYFVLRVGCLSAVAVVLSSFARWGLLSLNEALGNKQLLSNVFNVVFFLLCVAFAVIGLLLSFEISFRKSFFLVTISCLVEHLSRNVYAILQFCVPRKIMGFMYSSYYGYMGVNLLFVMLFAFLYWLIALKKLINKFDYEETLKDNRFIVVAAANLFVCVGVASFTSFTISGNANSFTVLIICPIYAILCCFLGLYLQINIVASNKLKNDNKTLDILIKRESEKDVSFSENMETLRIEMHDLKKRLQRLEEIDIDSEEKFSIIEDSNALLEKYNSFVKTGNPVIDGLLANKYILAIKEEIDFTYFVDAKTINFMSNNDIVSLFDNLLSNAFEAAINEEKGNRIIHLQISKEKQMTMIVIRNYSSQAPSFDNGVPVTSKDKKYHGYGVKSIKRIVEKYNGEVNFSYNNSSFSCRIIFFDSNENA